MCAMINGNFKLKTVFQNLPNTVCSGRFTKFRLRAFSRSKTLFHFGSWFSW